MSVAVAALADLDEILRRSSDQARELLDADVAVLLAYGPDGEAQVAAASGPDDGIDRAGGFPGAGAARFVRPTSRSPGSRRRSSGPARRSAS